eukprot:COSAG01_NODE_1065_length_11883_cov_104.177868_3_plen_237_part_00
MPTNYHMGNTDAESAAAVRRARASKRREAAKAGFDLQMRASDASFNTKTGDKQLRKQGRKLAKGGDASSSSEESGSEEEEDSEEEEGAFDDGGAAYDAANSAAIEEQNVAFEVEKRAAGPRTRKQKMKKKLQGMFPCCQRGGAAIGGSTAVTDKDVDDLIGGVLRSSSAATFDVDVDGVETSAPRGTPPAGSANEFALDDDASMDVQQVKNPVAAPPAKPSREVGLAIAVEEDDES